MIHRRIEQDEAMTPTRDRPARLQVAALCLRRNGAGREVLLITSRGTGRWILPKGWPIPGKTLAEAAAQEAWEEAGVTGATAAVPLGSYGSVKVMEDGRAIPCRVEVFEVAVEGLAERYPEAGQRRRAWMPLAEAARQVQEPELRALLAAI